MPGPVGAEAIIAIGDAGVFARTIRLLVVFLHPVIGIRKHHDLDRLPFAHQQLQPLLCQTYGCLPIAFGQDPERWHVKVD